VNLKTSVGSSQGSFRKSFPLWIFASLLSADVSFISEAMIMQFGGGRN
jgi:hypothetical protein